MGPRSIAKRQPKRQNIKVPLDAAAQCVHGLTHLTRADAVSAEAGIDRF